MPCLSRAMLLSWLAAALLTAGSPAALAGAPIELPPGAVNPKVNALLWVDLRSLTPESLAAARDAIEKVLPAGDEKAERRQSIVASLRKGEAVITRARTALLEAGVENILLIELPKAEQAPAATNAMVFLRLRDGARPEAVVAQVRQLLQAERKLLLGNDAPLDLEKLELSTWSKQWSYFKPPGVDLPRQEEEAQAIHDQFAKAFAAHPNAPVRLALRLSDATRQQLKETLLQPAAIFVGGLLQPLLSLEYAAVGLHLGDAPKLQLSMQFGNAVDAAQFKTALQGFTALITRLAPFASNTDDGNSGELTPEQTRAAYSIFVMTQDEATLSTQINTQYLKRLNEVGLDWTEKLNAIVKEPQTPAEPK